MLVYNLLEFFLRKSGFELYIDAGRGYQVLFVSFFTFALVTLAYLVHLEKIQHELTRTLQVLLDAIRSLRPSSPGEELEIEDISCDDELHEVVSALNTKSKQIQEYINYLKKLIGYVQHEFNTPLAIAQLHVDRLAKKDSFDQSDLAGLQEELHHMGGLIDSIISLMKAESDSFETESVDLGNLLRSITQQIQELYPESNFILLGKRTVVLETSKQYVRAIFRNLLENSIKHGSDTVEITLEEDHVSIQDFGEGIDDGYIDRIWLPFWKKITKRGKPEGFGLGLSLVQTLVSRLGRNIMATSNTNDGLTFTVKFS